MNLGRGRRRFSTRAKIPKLRRPLRLFGGMVESGYHPVIFCRFVATAKYVADQLGERLKTKFPSIHVIAVTERRGDDEPVKKRSNR